MTPEEVPADLVEKAARAMREAHTRSRLVTTWEGTTGSVRDQWRNDARHALAAVLPEIQAQAWDAGYAKGNLDGYFGTSDEKNPHRAATPGKAT